jgi:excisionase family DNA binding protein
MKIMTVQEAARYLRVSSTLVRRLARQGEIPGTQVGRQWRFAKEQLDEWMREQSKARREDE